MVNIAMGKVSESTSGAGASRNSCINNHHRNSTPCSNTPKNEDYQEIISIYTTNNNSNSSDSDIMKTTSTTRNQEVAHDIKQEKEAYYNPEMDSPSSWASNNRSLFFFLGRRGLSITGKCAKYTRIICNLILILCTIAGIIYGILQMTTTSNNNNSNDNNNDNKNNNIGTLILFSAIVGGAVSIILVNLAWIYHNNRYDMTFEPSCCCSDCTLEIPLASLSSTIIIICVGVILIPTYRDNKKVILVLLFGVLVPLMILVNIPLLFESNDDDDDNDNNRDYDDDINNNMTDEEIMNKELEKGNIKIVPGNGIITTTTTTTTFSGGSNTFIKNSSSNSSTPRHSNQVKLTMSAMD